MFWKAVKINEEYIRLTDMVSSEEGSDHIRNWMRNRITVEFKGLWETLHNPNFKGVEFDRFGKQAESFYGEDCCFKFSM